MFIYCWSILIHMTERSVHTDKLELCSVLVLDSRYVVWVVYQREASALTETRSAARLNLLRAVRHKRVPLVCVLRLSGGGAAVCPKPLSALAHCSSRQQGGTAVRLHKVSAHCGGWRGRAGPGMQRRLALLAHNCLSTELRVHPTVKAQEGGGAAVCDLRPSAPVISVTLGPSLHFPARSSATP